MHELLVFLISSVIVHYNTTSLTQIKGYTCMSTIGWNDNAPIYRQLKDRVVGMMLDGLLKPGDALPSVRQIAADYQLNPITVSRAYQELVDETLVEKRRGLGMYVTDGARDKLLATERERFLREEWPAMLERIRRLGLELESLLKPAAPGGAA
jgi:GntR family transcriptional regulator